MKNIVSQLVFNRHQQVGILLLLGINVTILIARYHYEPISNSAFNITSEEIAAKNKFLESLKAIELERRKPKIYPFNPNFLTDYRAYTLGISSEAFDRLKAFREKDMWINSAADFQKVTGVTDSLLHKIEPYFKFPDWVSQRRITRPKVALAKPKSFEEKIDLNLATKIELQQVFGIGEKLSERIVKYRKKIGGFSNDLQLNEVWGLNTVTVNNALKSFTVKTPKVIHKIPFHSASASDIATIPGVSFELATEIWEFRTLRESVSSFSELEKIEGLTPRKLQLIQLYLSLE